MVQGIRDAANMLFSRGVSEDMARLNTTLVNLEKGSPDILLFVSLLQIEVLKKAGRRAPYSRALSAQLLAIAKKRQRRVSLTTRSEPSTVAPRVSHNLKILSSVKLYQPKRSQKQQQLIALRQRLEAASAEISKAVELADSHNLEDLEWLAYWAGILREAKEQGRDVLGAIANAKSSIVECVQEDEFSSFVHRLEGLATDVEYFEKLMHVFYPMASAVTGELTSRVLSGLIQMFGKQAAAGEKLQRLEMLLIKIHSAVEASEKRTIKNLWLLRWREKLKEAASQGDEVLASFIRKAEDAEATRGVDTNQQQGSSSSSSAASARATGALSFTSKSMLGMVQGIRDATQVLFSSDKDMEKLNSTLDMLEQLSIEIREFIRLFQLEDWAKVDLTSTESMEAPTTEHRPRKKMRITRNSGCRLFGLKLDEEDTKISAPCVEDAVVNKLINLSINETAAIQKEQCEMLLDKLEEGFANICKTVELADSHDLGDMKWLAYWADILREAKIKGCVVLGTISARKTLRAKDNEPMVKCDQDQERDQFSSFVHSMEGLARDVECFGKLVYMCSRC
ncbi:unnamed protein product [Triticum turgidum subsp. durum]|uniref:Uncharacterized protein n=1 Tax=Triticum turgidum subsp. durum TaxID=4567 RepID=A0A9R0U1T2_TRITD|nr:unnamed protein product [Triticum turgidum subsp. durum]